MSTKSKYISLGEAALLLRVHKSNLAWYRKVGLLREEFVNGRMYLFNRAQLLRTVKKIKKLKDRGYKLGEIKEELYGGQN